MAAHFFQGLGNSPASTVGLAIINEYTGPPIQLVYPRKVFLQGFLRTLSLVFLASVFIVTECGV